MKTFNYVITDEIGLHARPAGLLVKEAGKFTSSVALSCKGKEADGKRLLAIMGLGVKQGDEVTIKVTGEDEEAAAGKLAEFFKTNL